MGDPNVFLEDWGYYGECDPGRMKHFMLDHQNELEVEPFFDVCFAKVPEEELYNKNEDPAMIQNLAANSDYEDVLKELRGKLHPYLTETKDPRVQGESPWDDYNFDKPVGKVVENK